MRETDEPWANVDSSDTSLGKPHHCRWSRDRSRLHADRPTVHPALVLSQALRLRLGWLCQWSPHCRPAQPGTHCLFPGLLSAGGAHAGRASKQARDGGVDRPGPPPLRWHSQRPFARLSHAPEAATGSGSAVGVPGWEGGLAWCKVRVACGWLFVRACPNPAVGHRTGQAEKDSQLPLRPAGLS
jgi:hypothetical protein